jgi:hypothetical protein
MSFELTAGRGYQYPPSPSRFSRSSPVGAGVAMAAFAKSWRRQ